MEKSNQYSGGKVEFLDEKIDGEYGVVSIPNMFHREAFRPQ